MEGYAAFLSLAIHNFWLYLIAMFQLVLRVIGAYIGVGVLSMKRIAGWALGVMLIGGSLVLPNYRLATRHPTSSSKAPTESPTGSPS